MTDRDELAKLDLRLQRSRSARDQFRTLLAAATATLVSNRRQVKELKARIARRSSRAAQALKTLRALKSGRT